MSRSLKSVIRKAICDNSSREFQYQQIMKEVECTRTHAKQLFFAFLYYAGDDFLEAKLVELKLQDEQRQKEFVLSKVQHSQ